MEKNLVSMAREVEKLRVELSSSDNRPPWSASAGITVLYVCYYLVYLLTEVLNSYTCSVFLSTLLSSFCQYWSLMCELNKSRD
jgi:hypothetical protein